MGEWRDRGFVRDSDDDDDEDETTIETQSETRPERELLRKTHSSTDGGEENVVAGLKDAGEEAVGELEGGHEVEHVGEKVVEHVGEKVVEEFKDDHEVEHFREAGQVESVGGIEELGHREVEHAREVGQVESAGGMEESGHFEESSQRNQSEENGDTHSGDGLQRDRGLEDDDIDELALDQSSPATHNQRQTQRRPFVPEQSPVVPEQSPVSDDGFNLLSSPLSSIGPEVLTPPHLQPSVQQNSGGNHPERQLNSPITRQHVEVHILVPNTSLHLDEERRVGRQRNFRERKAIQVHPYALDRMRYEREMKSRGVKPVRIAISSQPRRLHKDQEEDQDETQSSRQSQSSAIEEASTAGENLSTPRNGTPRISSPVSTSSPPSLFGFGEGQELPDVPELLRNRLTKEKGLQVGNKRRKITYQRRSAGASSSVGKVRPATDIANTVIEPENIFDLPDSPLQTNAPSLPQLGQHRIRIPSPISLEESLLPEASSGTKIRSARRSRGIAHDTTPAPTRTQRRTVVIQAPTPQPVEIQSESSSESEIDPTEEIKAVQKRIKGVLPASWLKLDLEAREKSSKQKQNGLRQLSTQLEEEPQLRGVARRTIRTGSNAQSPIPILFDDDLDQSDSEAPQPNFGPLFDDDVPMLPARTSSMPLDWLLDDDPGEAMEDNSIDRMFPTASRVRTTSKSSRKRQTKLKDAFDHSSKRLKTGEPSAYSTSTQPGVRMTDGHGQRRKRKAKAPKLSVLDVLEDNFSNGSTVPKFLKIAARQARQHADDGRQSPTNKHIRLQTHQDTQDTALILQKWRSGVIQPRTSKQGSSTQTRLPLGERSNNPQSEVAEQPNGMSVTGPKVVVRKKGRLRQTQLHPVARPHPTNVQGHTKSIPSRPKERWRLPPRLPNRFHNAQLEMEEQYIVTPKGPLDFERGISSRQREFEQLYHAKPPSIMSGQSPQIGKGSKFTGGAGLKAIPAPLKDGPNARPAQIPQKRITPKKRIKRKRETHRVDIDTKEYRQPEEFVLPSSHRSESIEPRVLDQVTLQDLSPFGVPYTKDFDMLPLPLGTYFHESTFIGSGDFSRALLMNHRNMDVDAGRHVVYIEGKTHIWSQWNEDMASSVHDIFQSILTQLSTLDLACESVSRSELTNIAKVIQRVVKANVDWLSFSDPIDRELCVSRYLECLQPLQTTTIEYLEAAGMGTTQFENKSLLVRLVALQITLLQQLLSIFKGHSSAVDIREQATQSVKSLCTASLRYLTRHGFDEIRTFYVQNSRHSVRDAGIKENQLAMEILVVILHVLDTEQFLDYSFWDAFNIASLPSISSTTRVGTLERAWYNMFAVLPLFELDANGILQVGRRFTKSCDNWTGVKAVMSRVFALYPATSSTVGTTINEYVRALLTRCHHLIQGWSWRKCEAIIGIIFDFFARNSLAPLRKEDTHGSPRFLENLVHEPSLDVAPEDKSFHIFLKIVALGLRGMRRMYPDKKIRSIAWRCIPNHGRTYQKDQELKQEDLDALRNHHDLLCTLYWASPPGFRPRVDLIQTLVDHAASHREACRLNIKAWTNLARYQLSTGEDSEFLSPFASWFKDIVEQTIDQFKLARTEAETQYEAAKKDSSNLISQDILITTIARNQKHVLSSLVEAIGGLKSVVDSAKDFSAASELLRGSGLENVIALFNATSPRANPAIIECILAYQAYLNLATRSVPSPTSKDKSQTTSEESQDYGDWPELEGEEVIAISSIPSATLIPIDFVFEPVAQLLSNCFGAEKSPDDALLIPTVDTWTNIAWSTVQRGQYGWESFLDEHGSHSWSQLRETEQRKKYGPYFLSLVAELDSTMIENRSLFVSAWLSALVERDSQLKFQHRLTTVILNQLPGDVLLRNLPFSKRSANGKYDILMSELRERRLGLISSILANIQEHFNNNPRLQSELRQEYTTYLKQLMSSMKSNYIALQHHSDNVAGGYVVFVQRIVEFLQQYTFDICPIDKFFTDSIIFPLPASDPLYVVGKLKGYAAKLADAKEVRRLARFFQSVSERAAVDNEQQYLIEQLNATLCGELNTSGLSLKAVLIQAIFPAYIESSFTTQVGWIMAKPVLVACARTFDRMLYDFRVDDDVSVDAALALMESILAVLQRATGDLGDRIDLFQQSHALSTLSTAMDVVTAIMPSIDYIKRRTGRGKAAVRSIAYFKEFSVFAAKIALGVHDPFAPVLNGEEATPGAEHGEIREFCARELHRDLGSWRVDGGRYSVKRGTMWKEVVVSLKSTAEEREGLVHSIEEFHTVLDRMRALV